MKVKQNNQGKERGKGTEGNRHGVNTLEMTGSNGLQDGSKIKALTAKLEDLSLVQGPHTEREPTPAHCPMAPTKPLWHASPCPPTTK